jgi:hydrogenase/urease accessory protein HupE
MLPAAIGVAQRERAEQRPSPEENAPSAAGAPARRPSPPPRRACLGTAALISLCLRATAVLGHPLDPALLELREQHAAPTEVRFRAPLPSSLRPLLPERCVPLSAPVITTTMRSALQRWQVDCGADSLVGERIGVEGLRVRQTDAVVRIALRGGGLAQAVLRPDEPFITIPQRAGVGAVLRDYLRLGLTHILTGPDHLLFVLGLVLLVPNRRRLLWTITAFTLGHSATLSLAVLGFVHVPPAPIEVLIAVSIVVVAVELRRAVSGHARDGAMPVGMALSFGFLHGLGFAGALAQVELPEGEIPPALFAFNIGIEVGQLLCVAVALAAIAALHVLPVPWPAAVRFVPAYAIGSLAAFWVLERLAAIL